jgi:soluble lytic murein transglycosylase-like protein
MKKSFLIVSLLVALIFTSSVITSGFADETKKQIVADSVDSNYGKLPESIKLFNYIIKYAKEYAVPVNIAFGIAYKESGYKGPLHVNYNPKLTSKSKAYGPMQIKLGTANTISEKRITKSELLNNTELNVRLSMKLLSKLKEQYGTWKLALGAYNTGKPVVNQYAKNIVKFKSDHYFIWMSNRG